MSEKITEKDLSFSLSKSLNLDQAFVLEIIREYFKATGQYLVKEKMQAIPHLGTFKLRWHESYESYNPKLKREIKIPAHYGVRFHTALSLQKKLNQEMEIEEDKSDLSEMESKLRDPLFDEKVREELAKEKSPNVQLEGDVLKEKSHLASSYQEKNKEESKDFTQEEMKTLVAQEKQMVLKKRFKRMTMTLFFFVSLAAGLYYFLAVGDKAVPRKKVDLKLSATNSPLVSTTLARKVNLQWGDTLAKISEREYGDEKLWPYLYFENINTITSPLKLIPIKDKVFIRYQTNRDLGELYFELFKMHRKKTVEARLYLNQAYQLNPELIERHIKELSPEEKKLIKR